MNNNVLQELIPHFVLEDAPETFREIVSDIGIENVIKICRRANGDEIYFPQAESILRKTRDRIIKQEYRAGMTYKEISLKYDITSKQVQRILLN